MTVFYIILLGFFVLSIGFCYHLCDYYRKHPIIRDSSRIFYKAKDFKKLAILREHFDEIQKECLSVYQKFPITDKLLRKQEEWNNNLDTVQEFIEINKNSYWIPAWSDGWANYPLMIKDTVSPGVTREMCPKTIELLESIGGINIAGFSLVNPGGGIKPHTDSTGPSFGSLAYHLCLIGESTLTVNEQDIIQTPAKVIIFNPEYTHHLYNHTESDRIILYLDFDVAHIIDDSCDSI